MGLAKLVVIRFINDRGKWIYRYIENIPIEIGK